MAEEHDIELRLAKEIHTPTITLDEDRIEQVFTNLIDNAFRHTRAGGYILLNIYATHEMFRAEVEDNGVGILEEDLSFIFERFYKADKSRTRSDKKKGTGLGLAITKHIVTAHDGIISVKSKVNEGTTFSFKIPQQILESKEI